MVTADSSPQKVVLITGCSSGIGRAAADAFACGGHNVYATARRADSVAELCRWAEAFGGKAHAVRLDVTDAAMIGSVVSEIVSREGRIDVLVNNAGYGQIGAVEDVSLEAWRRQLETNVIGLLAATQAVLPAMRSAGHGRIVNVSSVVAHVAVPLMGAYCASKHAVEAASNTLRVEVAPFGIDVALIEPGPIATNFRPNVEANLADHPIREDGPYADMYRAMDAYWAQQSGGNGPTAADVAALIVTAATARRPRTRYRITSVAKWLPRILPFLPDRVFDWLVTRQLRAMKRRA